MDRPDNETAARQIRPGYTRLSIGVHLPAALARLGVDPSDFLRRQGFEPRLFANPERIIRYSDIVNLLEAGAQETCCEHFGLLVGQLGNITTLGVIGRWALGANSVGAALETILRFFQHQDRGATAVMTDGDEVALSYIVVDPSVHSAVQISDTATAIGFNLLLGLCGPTWRANTIELPRRRPVDPKPFHDFFGCPVKFDQSNASILFDATWIDRRIAEPDPSIHAALVRAPETRADDDFIEYVRALTIQRMLEGSDPSENGVADELKLTEQKLRRRLKRRGSKFRSLLEECRSSLAQRLLRDTDMALTDIATVLAYSQLSAFTRAFGAWTGMNPSKWRETVRIAPSGATSRSAVCGDSGNQRRSGSGKSG